MIPGLGADCPKLYGRSHPTRLVQAPDENTHKGGKYGWECASRRAAFGTEPSAVRIAALSLNFVVLDFPGDGQRGFHDVKHGGIGTSASSLAVAAMTIPCDNRLCRRRVPNRPTGAASRERSGHRKYPPLGFAPWGPSTVRTFYGGPQTATARE